MQLKIYSIRDTKSNVFNNPFYKSTHGEAERDFTSVVNDEKSMINKYPADFSLWYLGTYDSDSGRFESLPVPDMIIEARQCLIKEQ